MLKFCAALNLLLFCCFTGFAGPVSIATSAKVTSSSDHNDRFRHGNINDGIISVDGKGNWMAADIAAWIKMYWDTPQTVDKIVIYNFPSKNGQILTGTLEFSDGTSIEVNLPEDGTSHAVVFEPKNISFVRFVTGATLGSRAGLSEIEVFPAPDQFVDAVDWVDPYIETNRGRFFLFITGQRPYGLVSAAPMTKNWNNSGGGYAHFSDEILGFPQIHAWTLSGLNLMPTLENVDPTNGEDAWKSKFKHDDEIVRPGYHRVFLPDSKVWVEQTATERVSFYKFRWIQDTKAQLLLSLHGLLGNSKMTDAAVEKVSELEYEGSVSSVERAYNVGPKDVKIYFVVQVDKAWDSFDGWDDKERFKQVNRMKGDSLGVSLAYKVKAGDEVKMKIGVSYTSIDNARRNLNTECTTWDFDAVRQDTRNIWNEWLGKIKVKGGTHNQNVKFYTDLWHVLLGRHRINDVNGDYPDRTTGEKTNTGNLTDGFMTDANFLVKNPGKDSAGNVRHNMYNSDAFWLTQWNLNVLWGLAWPEIQDDMAASMVAYSQNGGLLPRGPSGGGYSFIMTGSPSTNLVVSTYMKDIMTKTDPEDAFKEVKRNHFPGGMMGGGTFFSKNLDFYDKKGWWPNNAGINIEAAFQDWGAAQMAKKLGKGADYTYFLKRSGSWKRCFHPEKKLLFPVDKEGNFTHDDPLSGNGFVEANAWQATWGVSHDIKGLTELMGGNEALLEKLNYAFEKETENNFVHSYGSGHISYANQPGCSNAHVFSYANAPWLTQYWVRRVNEKAYGGTTPDLGWGGHDEDQGQMGGVSALMSIGLFNIVGTESQRPYYEITAPVFDEITIALDKKYYQGDEFIIKTYNNSEANCYIQKAKLNGEDLDNFWFYHEDFAKGGLLEIWLGNQPNKNWGLKDDPPVD